MADDEPPEHPGVAKIKAMYDRGDFDTLERMVRFWDALEKLGLLGDMLRRFVIWTGIIAGGYLALSGHITEWIRNVARH